MAKEKPGVQFFPINQDEISGSLQHRVRPHHRKIVCGHCGEQTNARVVSSLRRDSDGRIILWCVCTCPKEEPTMLVVDQGNIVSQHPGSKEFRGNDAWPKELQLLFDEAARCFSAGAYTAAAMVARKLLMVIACDKGAKEGLRFVEYVDYITANVVPVAGSREPIAWVKDIGNDANHRVQFLARTEAQRSLKICRYILETVYALPLA